VIHCLPDVTFVVAAVSANVTLDGVDFFTNTLLGVIRAFCWVIMVFFGAEIPVGGVIVVLTDVVPLEQAPVFKPLFLDANAPSRDALELIVETKLTSRLGSTT